MIEAKPYTMRNPIQNYSWGSKGDNAFIPNLLDLNSENDVPYAELWMGAHPKASSEIEIDGSWQNLDTIIRKYPKETLGEKVIQRFGNKLPFLFKVLSAAEPLSIQMHPSIEQAKILHANDPINYPDENHKPEIAIALNYLKALVGFKTIEQIKEVIKKYDGFQEVINDEPIINLIESSYNDETDTSKNLENAYRHIILLARSNPTRFNKIIYRTISQLNTSSELSQSEELFISMYEKYGNDIGLISILFFNFIELKEGEAIFTPAGVPHAYIEGNIIECMANSDNVIRAGLTPKFKDIENLLNLTEYKTGSVQRVIQSEKDGFIEYQTTAEEFVVLSSSLNAKQSVSYSANKVRVVLVTKGKVIINYQYGSVVCEKGTVLFLPALLKEIELEAKEDSQIFLAESN